MTERWHTGCSEDGMSLNICVAGQSVLADAVEEGLEPYFNVSREPVADLDLLWVCYDTPLTPGEPADYDWVLSQIANLLAVVPTTVPVLISSQLPVGTIAELEKAHPGTMFACSPENLRVPQAAHDFKQQARVVVGRRDDSYDLLWKMLFQPFTSKLIFTTPETAELVKHTLNAWLGMNIAFINEIQQLADVVGAKMEDVETALLTERRISPNAPLRAGGRFAQGHLARELQLLTRLSAEMGLHTPLIDSILVSNGG